MRYEVDAVVQYPFDGLAGAQQYRHRDEITRSEQDPVSRGLASDGDWMPGRQQHPVG
jgi:hypothetical protein